VSFIPIGAHLSLDSWGVVSGVYSTTVAIQDQWQAQGSETDQRGMITVNMDTWGHVPVCNPDTCIIPWYTMWPYFLVANQDTIS